jgi:hypothetical protein
MTRDGDRDYWRREDARRAQLDRAFWQDYERRRSREHETLQDEARRLGLDSAGGPRTPRGSSTAHAMGNLAGPDAVNYPQAALPAERSQETTRLGPTHVVRPLPELVEDQAPAATAVDVSQADHDGDAAVGADVGERSKRGWIRRRLIALRTFVAPSGRTSDMIAALVERGGLFGYRRSMPWTDLPSPLDSSLGKRREQQ